MPLAPLAEVLANSDDNPSPDNKAGGLTTILEKSLGAVAKGRQQRLDGSRRVRRGLFKREA